jgi:hypothetical protein
LAVTATDRDSIPFLIASFHGGEWCFSFFLQRCMVWVLNIFYLLSNDNECNV